MPTRTTTASASFRTSVALVAVGLYLGGCPGPDGPEPIFPADWEATYREVRSCRRSIDHDNMHIRVVANELAYDPYLARTDALPEGSILLKIEYADDTCEEMDRFTVMRREAGFDPDRGDWHFQQVDLDRTVLSDHEERCARCHANCGLSSEGGFDGTCTHPP